MSLWSRKTVITGVFEPLSLYNIRAPIRSHDHRNCFTIPIFCLGQKKIMQCVSGLTQEHVRINSLHSLWYFPSYSLYSSKVNVCAEIKPFLNFFLLRVNRQYFCLSLAYLEEGREKETDRESVRELFWVLVRRCCVLNLWDAASLPLNANVFVLVSSHAATSSRNTTDKTAYNCACSHPHTHRLYAVEIIIFAYIFARGLSCQESVYSYF